MAIRIELWIDGHLVDGTEQWWDDIEASLPENGADFPLLRRVNPHDDVVFENVHLHALASEVRRFATDAPQHLRPFLEKLTHLCDEGARRTEAQLRFLGD